MKTSGRERLIEATRKLLWENGYESTSPKIIQKVSETGQGSFYHHFESKRDLAAAALEETRDQMLQELERAFLAPSPMERIRSWLKQQRNGQSGCRLGRLVMETSVVEDEVLRPILASYFHRLEQLLTESLQEAMAAGETGKSVEPGPLALNLISVVQGGYVLSRVHQDPELINKATDAALRMLVL